MEAVATAVPQAAPVATPVDFEALYRDYKARVFSTAYRLTRNRADAEDVTQDVFIRVFKKLGSFRGDSALSTWVYRITVNCALDLLRRRKRDNTVPLDDELETVSAPLSVMKLIEGALPSMPDGYRQVFVLHDMQGMKHFEIAGILGISEGASKSQLHRARAYLRRTLGPSLKAANR